MIRIIISWACLAASLFVCYVSPHIITSILSLAGAVCSIVLIHLSYGIKECDEILNVLERLEVR